MKQNIKKICIIFALFLGLFPVLTEKGMEINSFVEIKAQSGGDGDYPEHYRDGNLLIYSNPDAEPRIEVEPMDNMDTPTVGTTVDDPPDTNPELDLPDIYEQRDNDGAGDHDERNDQQDYDPDNDDRYDDNEDNREEDRDDNRNDQDNQDSNENESSPRDELKSFAENYDGEPQIGAMCLMEALAFIYDYFDDKRGLEEVIKELVKEFNDPLILINGIDLPELEDYFQKNFEFEILTTKQDLIEAIENGHPVNAVISYDDEDGDGVEDGHIVVIYGYEIDENGKYLFLYYDPIFGEAGYCADYDFFESWFIEIINVK